MSISVNTVSSTSNTVVEPLKGDTTVSRSVDDLFIGFKIESVNYADYKCDLLVQVRDSDTVRVRRFTDVSISGLLRSRLISKPSSNAVGVYYESHINSDDWRLNPFQLIRFDNSGVENYVLRGVDERPRSTVVLTDPLGEEYTEVRYRHYGKNEFKRYRNYVIK